MSAQTYTCRCRFCGYVVSYPRDDAGREMPCTRCAQMIRLPGKLANISGVERARTRDPLGIALEIGGFILMIAAYPWGVLAGAVLVGIGWKRCNRWVCGNCRQTLRSRWLESCPSCRTKFGSE